MQKQSFTQRVMVVPIVPAVNQIYGDEIVLSTLTFILLFWNASIEQHYWTAVESTTHEIPSRMVPYVIFDPAMENGPSQEIWVLGRRYTTPLKV